MQATSDGVYAVPEEDQDLRAMIRDLVRAEGTGTPMPMVIARSMR